MIVFGSPHVSVMNARNVYKVLELNKCFTGTRHATLITGYTTKNMNVTHLHWYTGIRLPVSGIKLLLTD